MPEWTSVSDFPTTPAAGDKLFGRRGSAAYSLDVSYFPVKNADGQWLFDKIATVTGASTMAARHTLNGQAGGGYVFGATSEAIHAHNMEFLITTGWVARATSASMVRQAGGNFEFYANTGLTIGSAFSPTLRYTINGTTGAITLNGGGFAVSGNSSVAGILTVSDLVSDSAAVVGTNANGWGRMVTTGQTLFFESGTLNSGGATANGFVFGNMYGASGAGSIRSASDNVASLGTGSFRFSVVFAATGTINTSDEREKRWRGGLTAAELRAAKRIARVIGIFQWRDSLAEKGEAARLHIGVLAQQVFAILEEEGLDWRRYAWCCYDEWEDQFVPVFEQIEDTPASFDDDGNEVAPATYKMIEVGQRLELPAGNRYGVRPDQLAMFLIAAQEQRLTALEAAMLGGGDDA